MASDSQLTAKRKGFERVVKYQLPHAFKKIGWGVFFISLIFLLVTLFIGDTSAAKHVAKYGILLGLLIVSISKEEVEDELMFKLRIESYTIAFIIAVIYALCIPLVEFTFDSIVESSPPELKGIGDFMILWMLLSLQVFYFEVLKRRH